MVPNDYYIPAAMGTIIPQVFPTCKYKEEYKDLAEQRKQLKEKSKARKDAEGFSLIFEEACNAINGEYRGVIAKDGNNRAHE